MYNGTKWRDRVVDADSGEVIEEGTNMSAGNFNNMEDGISDAHIAAALQMIATAARPLTCSITRNIKNATFTNFAEEVKYGAEFKSKITPMSGYSLTGAGAKITMDGEHYADIGSDGSVYIGSVVGDVVITANCVSI